MHHACTVGLSILISGYSQTKLLTGEEKSWNQMPSFVPSVRGLDDDDDDILWPHFIPAFRFLVSPATIYATADPVCVWTNIRLLPPRFARYIRGQRRFSNSGRSQIVSTLDSREQSTCAPLTQNEKKTYYPPPPKLQKSKPTSIPVFATITPLPDVPHG